MTGTGVENMRNWGLGEAAAPAEWQRLEGLPTEALALLNGMFSEASLLGSDLAHLAITTGGSFIESFQTHAKRLLPLATEAEAMKRLRMVYGEPVVENNPFAAETVDEYILLGQQEVQAKGKVVESAVQAEISLAGLLTQFRTLLVLHFTAKMTELDQQIDRLGMTQKTLSATTEATPEVAPLAARYKPEVAGEVEAIKSKQNLLMTLTNTATTWLDRVSGALGATVFTASHQSIEATEIAP